MGIIRKLFTQKEVVADPADLLLPNVIPTSILGLSLKKAAGVQNVNISIVGESFRAANVAAVAKAAEGKLFDIYLIAEPTNQHDKNAVAVYAANLHVGYIGKPDSKQWFKWVNEAFQRGELLVELGSAVISEERWDLMFREAAHFLFFGKAPSQPVT